jgi:RimJ/RimL family protein N-acetyltransferase
MKITIREAIPDDAERLVAFVRRLSEEPGLYIVMGPGEFTLTVEQERQVLADYAAADNCVFLVAEAQGQIIGTLNCRGGLRRAKRHEVVLGISVAREWRGQGVGKQLMARAIEWARGTGIVTRIELIVFARNEVARHLYEGFGFVVEGCLRQAILRDGEYFDDLVMGLLF